jgi:hypothetical protein
MSKWPDSVPIPKPVKPEGITEWEWQTYMNSSYRNISPELKAKVHAAMGWKVNDVQAAEEIAGQVQRVVEKADKETARELLKGHVPEENMARYVRLRELHHLISRMGNMVSGLGEHADANALWAMAGKYKRMANELRADLPGDGGTSPQT